MSTEIEVLLERLGPYLDECVPRITVDEVRANCGANRIASLSLVGLEEQQREQSSSVSEESLESERPYVHGGLSLRGRRVRMAAALAVVAIVAATAVNVLSDRGSTSMRLGGVSGTSTIALARGVGSLYDATTAIPADWTRSVNRDAYRTVVCTDYIDTPSGPTCMRLEGPLLVSAFSYTAPSIDGEVEDKVPPILGPPSISIATTFTELPIERFTNRLGTVVAGPVGGPTPGSSTTPTTVNELPGLLVYSPDSKRSVVWSPSPGVIVVVEGNRVEIATLLDVARGVAPAVDFTEAAVPVLAAAVDGVRWTANDNNHPYLLATKRGGRECVGFGWVDDECGQRFPDRIYSRFVDQGRLILSGAVPPATTIVRIERAGLEPLLLTPNAVTGFASKFFAVNITDWSPVAVIAVGPDGEDLGHFVDGVDTSEHTVRIDPRRAESPSPTTATTRG